MSRLKTIYGLLLRNTCVTTSSVRYALVSRTPIKTPKGNKLTIVCKHRGYYYYFMICTTTWFKNTQNNPEIVDSWTNHNWKPSAQRKTGSGRPASGSLSKTQQMQALVNTVSERNQQRDFLNRIRERIIDNRRCMS